MPGANKRRIEENTILLESMGWREEEAKERQCPHPGAGRALSPSPSLFLSVSLLCEAAALPCTLHDNVVDRYYYCCSMSLLGPRSDHLGLCDSCFLFPLRHPEGKASRSLYQLIPNGTCRSRASHGRRSLDLPARVQRCLAQMHGPVACGGLVDKNCQIRMPAPCRRMGAVEETRQQIYFRSEPIDVSCTLQCLSGSYNDRPPHHQLRAGIIASYSKLYFPRTIVIGHCPLLLQHHKI